MIRSDRAKPAGGPSRPPAGSRRSRRWRDGLIVAVTTLGLGLMMYPSAASWFYQRAQAQTVSGYVDQVAALPPQVRTDLLSPAQVYNDSLPPGPFRDPYTMTEYGDPAATAEANAHYASLLMIDGTDVMARLKIPAIRVDLPIFHGVDAATLERGVGHLPQSSLPVGGPGTHAVLVAHTGVENATLFTDLDRLVVGDRFTIDVIGETLYYQVDSILTVEPDDLDALQIIPGMDYVTLVTCTPKWVNTHRLLVRGVRVPAPDATAPGEYALATNPSPGVPWWAIVIVGGLVAALVTTRFVLAPAKRPQEDSNLRRKV